MNDRYTDMIVSGEFTDGVDIRKPKRILNYNFGKLMTDVGKKSNNTV
jgi:hypothetical protein